MKMGTHCMLLPVESFGNIICFFLWMLLFLDVVKVELGHNVILPCEAGGAAIRVVEWTRPDLESPEYVLLYRGKRTDTTHQHSSFAGRVQLVDTELKNGNISLRLETVSKNDSGTYECRVAVSGSRREKRANIEAEPIKSIQLEVTNSGEFVDFSVFSVHRFVAAVYSMLIPESQT